MSNLIIISGPIGTGKTTISRLLYASIEKCAYIESEWLLNMTPFVLNEKTMDMLGDNINTVVSNYIANGYDNIILSCVLNTQEIVQKLIVEIDSKFGEKLNVYSFDLTSNFDVLESRKEEKIKKLNIKEQEMLKELLHHGNISKREPNSVVIDTSVIKPGEAKTMIMEMVFGQSLVL